MSYHSKKCSGIKIAQQPGGTSSFSLDWGYKEETVKKMALTEETNTNLQEQQKNPEKQFQMNNKVI